MVETVNRSTGNVTFVSIYLAPIKKREGWTLDDDLMWNGVFQGPGFQKAGWFLCFEHYNQMISYYLFTELRDGKT
jgi:hypothetical protein